VRSAVLLSVALVATGVLAAPASAEIAARIKIQPGDTLTVIARKYDCTVAAIQRANALDGELILAGQRLAVPVCKGKDAARKPGAARVRVARVEPIEIPLVGGQSVGKPWSGKLRNGVKLPSGNGYLIRRPARAFGAAHVVAQVRQAIRTVRTDHRGLHTLAIGDLSQKKGGAITEHRSHQSGRDLDIGFYFKRKPAGYPEAFVSAASTRATSIACSSTPTARARATGWCATSRTTTITSTCASSARPATTAASRSPVSRPVTPIGYVPATCESSASTRAAGCAATAWLSFRAPARGAAS
jgi:LysM repeat protein